MNPPVARKATLDDVPELVRFVNAVFHVAEISAFMVGDRTNASEITKALQNGTTILLIENPNKNEEYAFLGSVAIKSSTSNKIVEIGMLSVLPTKQSSGIGTILMNTAMDYGKNEMGAEEIEVGIINIRTRMMDWYERRFGFKDTGKIIPFHSETEEPTVPLHLCLFKRPAPYLFLFFI